MTALTATFALLLATLVSLVGTPPLRRLAHARGWIDRPGGVRKQHPFPVPRVGGVVIFGAFAVSLGMLIVVGAIETPLLAAVSSIYGHVLVAGTIVLGVGLLDDIRGVGPLTKLASQLVAASYLYINSFRIGALSNPLGGEAIQLGLLALPLTLLWLVGVSNAFNLIDGLDGLASGIALCSTATLFVAASVNGRYEVALLAAALGGALLGFLRYNVTPASIFLGDSGALFVGIALAAFAVRGNMKSSAAIAVAAPLLALAVPLLDTAAAVARRLAQGRPLFQPDDQHVHHRLLQRGWTPARAVLALYGMAAAFGALSLLAVGERGAGLGLTMFAASAVVWVGLQQLGFPRIARSLGILDKESASPLHSDSLRIELEGARDLIETWTRLTEMVARLGFERLDLRVSDQLASRLDLEPTPPPAEFPVWVRPEGASSSMTHTWRIPLEARGIKLGGLELRGPLGAGGPPAMTRQTAEAIAQGVSSVAHRLLVERTAPAALAAPGRH